jgi:hypothetical protein
MEILQFPIQDQRYALAAEGWLGLSNLIEADEELEQITPKFRAHPLMLTIQLESIQRLPSPNLKKLDFVT